MVLRLGLRLSHNCSQDETTLHPGCQWWWIPTWIVSPMSNNTPVLLTQSNSRSRLVALYYTVCISLPSYIYTVCADNDQSMHTWNMMSCQALVKHYVKLVSRTLASIWITILMHLRKLEQNISTSKQVSRNVFLLVYEY